MSKHIHNVLGIETSCDETAAAVVANGRTILSNVIVSSLAKHKKYGGIIPEIASRKQIEVISLIICQSLGRAGLSLRDIDAIAVTANPGLVGSLLVGTATAHALAYALSKPLITVDHIQGHLYANFLTVKGQQPAELPRLPAVGLVVSGGHTSLFYVKTFRDFSLLGQTRDDAVGESYDKVARILGLGYPGGPIIDRLATSGENHQIRFACAELPGSLDFSFSGIKTAVFSYVTDQNRFIEKSKIPIHKIVYAFQNSVVDLLVRKSLKACEQKRARVLLVGGGVAANSALRQRLDIAAKGVGIKVFFPNPALCTDNAAMVAGLGFHFMKGKGVLLGNRNH